MNTLSIREFTQQNVNHIAYRILSNFRMVALGDDCTLKAVPDARKHSTDPIWTAQPDRDCLAVSPLTPPFPEGSRDRLGWFSWAANSAGVKPLRVDSDSSDRDQARFFPAIRAHGESDLR